jgi:hypothetical protein
MLNMEKENVSQLTPQSQFPEQALTESVQKPPKEILGGGNLMFTWTIASAADSVVPWGRNVVRRDQQLRDFWPTESFLAGTVAEVSLRNASYAWEIKAKSERVINALTDMFRVAIARDTVGWIQFVKMISQDIYTQDNGCFIELIRDPGNSDRFQNERAPVIGIAHMDSNQCMRTGDPEIPVIYTDRDGRQHKMKWYQVIAMSDFPSTIEKMNGVGHCAVTRSLRMAQIMRSISIFKDEKISGRQYKTMHFVSGVSRQDIKDEMKRGQEEANNQGTIRFMLPAILASLDPEKPVSTATIDLANLPDGFDYDQEMRWYISALSLDFNVDYQQLAPLASGNIGSSAQSTILHRKSSGKSPVRALFEAFKNYGVLPRDTDIILQDRNEGEELEKQELRTKALEEEAIAVNARIVTPEAAAKSLVRRGIYSQEEIDLIPQKFWDDAMNQDPAGKNVTRGGNTIAEDAARQETGKPKQRVGDRLRKVLGWEKSE